MNPRQTLKKLLLKSNGAVPPSPWFVVDVAIAAARKAISLVPASSQRLTGKLARDGGQPVRDKRIRPWPRYPAGTIRDWTFRAGPALGRVFRTGPEGWPQPLAQEFARQWAAYCGVRHALLLPHGTDALRLALAAALDHDGLDYGGEVIVPNLSFIASATAALDRRFGVALVDVDPDTLNISPVRVEEAIVPSKTKAIMAVHLFGQPADMAALRDIAKRHSLVLIEDAAQAHGAVHELGMAGSLGDAAGFSFQSSKSMTAGEGGALTTSDSRIFERVCSLQNAGRALIGAQRWGHDTLGWNCRPTEYVAAVLLDRLRTFETEELTRETRFHSLRRRLTPVSCVAPLAIGPGVKRHGAYMFVFRYRPEHCGGLDTDDFLAAIIAEGIPLDRAYDRTLAQQPAVQNLGLKRPEYVRVLDTPVADAAVKNLLYLPHALFLGSEGDMAEVAAAFTKVQQHYAPGAFDRTPAPAVALPSVHVTAPTVATVRCGIIGTGVMGGHHADVLRVSPRAKLVAVTDAQPAAADAAAKKYECRAMASPEELIGSGLVDAVIIATPHWQHTALAVAALKAGLHVACEKPLTATVADADDLLAAAASARGRFAVIHQTRLDPAWRKAKELIASGTLGPVLRASMIETAWRTDAYFRSAPWRGTWKGEGGGVLLNQAPHLLDRYAWLCGMPASVLAQCDTNLHRIEVEDVASAILRHASGAHGFIHVSTTEAPPLAQATVCCDRGRIVIEGGRLRVTTLKGSLRERTAAESSAWAEMAGDTREQTFPVLAFAALLQAFHDNFLASILDGDPLVCPGAEGRSAVELANAILLSSDLGAAVSLPLDREAYNRFIEKKTRS